ncbi:MAG: family 78 glycoside hydrolase catalytic domain [Lachnospiraceae bacterium]|nr:family 78 glycoside hydrolase catalytic domain [Lachnospiraceae bacterium]MDD3616724.1 family 78 glycoside hydrolase catalytic domain [Lachnospiraceae bacterium]
MNMLGQWISNGTSSPFYARKEIEVQKEIESAQAKVCGLGQFVFSINGEKVSDHELDPGWTNYQKLIEYVTFDVTEQLQNGKNVLGVEVGNGWYIKNDEHYTFTFPEFMPPNPNPYKPYGDMLVLACLVEIKYTDGTMENIFADDTWKTMKHPVCKSNVYGSETINGAWLQIGWNTSDYDDCDWTKAVVVNEDESPKGKLISQFQPAIKVIKKYEGRYMHQANGRDIYDFQQNMSGLLSFRIKGKAGDVVRIYPAEKLDANGDVDQVAKNWVTVDNCITYTVGTEDEWEAYRMQFTYFACRFIAIEKSSQDIEIEEIKADAISSAWKQTGSFACDDRRYEQIYDLVEKAVEANMVSVHTDCPTIERFAWQEPNHLMAPAIMYMKDGKLLWEKFLLDMRVEQHTKDDFFLDYAGNKFYPGEGLMPSQCPCYIPNVLPVPGMGSFYDIIPWGSTCILGTRWHYMFYGDQKIIEDNYEAGKRYFNYLKSKVTEEGFINHGLGDWGNPEQELARENVETAFFYADAKTLAWFAEILGVEEDVKEYQAFAKEICDNYNHRLLVQNEKGQWVYKSYEHQDSLTMTQACEALPLYWGMVPEDKTEDVVCAFRQTLAEKNCFSSGEVGLPYIIQTAAKYDMNDLICEFITKETHPSYYAFVLDGLTTLGEYWEENPRSHCHDMMGHITEWYYNGIAGIIPKKPGFAEILIKPYLPESMKEFSCTYESANGTIKVHVKESEDEILLETEVSENMKKEIDVSNLEVRNKKVVVWS